MCYCAERVGHLEGLRGRKNRSTEGGNYMWVEYRCPLSTVYNDGEISTCGWIIEVHSVQSTMMGRSQNVGRL